MSIQNDQKLQSKDIPLSTGLQKTQPDFTAVPAPEKQLELRIRVHIQTLISTVGAIHRSKRPCVLTVPFRCGAGHWVISSPHGSRSRWHSSHEGCVGGGSKHHCWPERQKRKTRSTRWKAAAAFTQTATVLGRRQLGLCARAGSVWQNVYGIIYTAAIAPCPPASLDFWPSNLCVFWEGA